MNLPILSLWQPWATLWVSGLKNGETRSWPTKHRGELVVHAARRWSREQQAACFEPLIRQLLASLMPKGSPYCMDTLNVLLPRGRTIGVVHVTDCLPITEGYVDSDEELACGDFTPGRYHWITDHGRRCTFAEPLPIVGRQRIFHVDNLLLSRQVAAARRAR